ERVRARRGGGEAATRVDARVHLGGGEDFEDGEERGLTQSVGVPAQEDRAADALVPAEVDDGRGDGRDVRLVEGAVEARAAVPRSAEAHGLGGHRGVGNEIVIGVEKRGDVHEILILGQLASACSHIPTLPNPLRGAQLCPRSSCIVDGAEESCQTSRLQQTPLAQAAAQSGGSELVSSSSFVSPPRTSRPLSSDESLSSEDTAPSPAAWASLGSRSTGTPWSAAICSSLSSGVCELPSSSVSEPTLTADESISFTVSWSSPAAPSGRFFFSSLLGSHSFARLSEMAIATSFTSGR